MRIALIPAILLSACVTLAFGAAAEPLPTSEEVHKLFDDQQYPQVLQKLQRVLALKGEAAKPYNRHDLLRLRGETQLRLKATAPAAQAFGDAGDAAGDLKEAAIDKSTELLIKRSPGLNYTPKTKALGKPADPIGVVASEDRKRALTALFGDELAVTEPKIKAVRDARQLAPILQVVPAIKQLRILELGATGADDRTKKMTADLGNHARDLMADAVKSMSRPVDDIEKSANEYITVQESVMDPRMRTPHFETRWRKRGVDRKDQGILKDTATTCAKIIQATRELGEALGLPETLFATVKADAEKLGRKAEQVLNDDYSRVHATRPQS